MQSPSPYITMVSIVCTMRAYAPLYPVLLVTCLKYAIAAAPLLAAVACGMDEELKGVMYFITLTGLMFVMGKYFFFHLLYGDILLQLTSLGAP